MLNITNTQKATTNRFATFLYTVTRWQALTIPLGDPHDHLLHMLTAHSDAISNKTLFKYAKYIQNMLLIV